MLKPIATLGPVGLMKPAPGTWGSLVATCLAWPVIYAGGWAGLLCGTLIVWIVGHLATTHYTEATGIHDPSEVLIDEVVGQWITLWPVAVILPDVSMLYLALGFLLFRLFDILKPWPISWVDRNIEGAWGVMLDDVLAGIAASVCLAGLILWGVA